MKSNARKSTYSGKPNTANQEQLRMRQAFKPESNVNHIPVKSSPTTWKRSGWSLSARARRDSKEELLTPMVICQDGKGRLAASNCDVSSGSANAENVAISEKKSPDQRSLWSLFSTPKAQDNVDENIGTISNGSNRVQDEELTPHHVKVPSRDPRIRKRDESETKKSPPSFNLFSKMRPLRNASRNFFANLGKKPDVPVSQDHSATSVTPTHSGDIEIARKTDNHDHNCKRPSTNLKDNNTQSLNERLRTVSSDAECSSVFNEKESRGSSVLEDGINELSRCAKAEGRLSTEITMPTLTLPEDIEHEGVKSNISSEQDESECLFIDEQARADCPSDIDEDSAKIEKEKEESHVLRVWSLQSEEETNNRFQNVDHSSSFSGNLSSFLDDSLPQTSDESLDSLERFVTENTVGLREKDKGDVNESYVSEESCEKILETTNAAQRSAESNVHMMRNFEKGPPKLQAQPNTHHLLQELDSLLECSTFQSDPHSSIQPESLEGTSGMNSLNHSRESDSSDIAEPARNIFSLFGGGKKSLSPNIVEPVEHQPIEHSPNSSYRSGLSKDAIVLSGSCSGEREKSARAEYPKDSSTVNSLLNKESPESGLQTLSSNLSPVAPAIALSSNDSGDTSLYTPPIIKSIDTCIPSLTRETGTGEEQGNEQNLQSNQPPELSLEVNPSSVSIDKEISLPSSVIPVPEEDNFEGISFIAFETRNDLCSYSKTMKLKMQRKTTQTSKVPAKKCVYPVVKNVKMKKRKKNPIEAKIKALEQDLLLSMESRGLTEIVHPVLSRKGVALDKVKKNDLFVNVRNEELERISHKSKKSKHKKKHRSRSEDRPLFDVRWPGKHSNPFENSRAKHRHSSNLLMKKKSIGDEIHGHDHVRKPKPGHYANITLNRTTSSDPVKVVGLEHGKCLGLQKNISQVKSIERSDEKTEIKRSKPKHSSEPQEWEIFSSEVPALSERPSLKLKFISKAKMMSPTKVEQSPLALSTKPRESMVPLKSPSSHIPVNVQQLHVPSSSATAKVVVPVAPSSSATTKSVVLVAPSSSATTRRIVPVVPKPVEEKAQPTRLPAEESLPFKPFEKPVASKKSAFVSDALEDLLQGAGMNKQMKPLISPSTMSVSNAKVVFKVPSKQSHSVKTLDMALKRQKPVSISSHTSDKMLLGFKDSQNERNEMKKKKKKKKNKHKDRPKEEKVKKGYVFGTGPDDLVRKLPNLPFSCYGKTLARPLFARQHQVSDTVGKQSKGFLEVRNVLSLSGKNSTKCLSDEVDVLSIQKIKQEPEEIDETPLHINENLPPILNINLPHSGKDEIPRKEEKNIECVESQRKEGQSSSGTSEVKKCGEYCRLGCICSSLNDPRTVQERSSHCGKVDCMFDCVCKRISTQAISSTRIRRRPTFAQDMLFYDDSYKIWKYEDKEISTKEAKKLQLLDHLPATEKRNLVSTCARTRLFVTDKPEKWIKRKRKPDDNRTSEANVAHSLASESLGAHLSNKNQVQQNETWVHNKQQKSGEKQRFIPLSVPSDNQSCTVKNIPAQSTSTLPLCATSSQGNAVMIPVMSSLLPVPKQYLLNGNVMNMLLLPNGNKVLVPVTALPNAISSLSALSKPPKVEIAHQQPKANGGSSISSVTSGFQKPILPVRYQITSSGIAISPAPVALVVPKERSNISQGTISLAVHSNPGIIQTTSVSTNSRFHATASLPGDVISVSSTRKGSDIRDKAPPRLNSPGLSAQSSVLVKPPVGVKAPTVTIYQQNTYLKSAPVEALKSDIDMQKKPPVEKHKIQAKSASHKDQHSPSSTDIRGDSESGKTRITKTFYMNFTDKHLYCMISTDTDFQWTNQVESVVKQTISLFYHQKKPEGSTYMCRGFYINLLSKTQDVVRLSLTLSGPSKKNTQQVAQRTGPTCSSKENMKGDDQVTGDVREPTYVNKGSTCSNIEPTCSSKENVKGDDQVIGDDQVTGDGREPNYVNKESTCSNIEPTCSSKENVKGDDQVTGDGREPNYVNKESTCSNIEPTCSSKENVKGDDQVMGDDQVTGDGREPNYVNKESTCSNIEPTCSSKENVKGDDQVMGDDQVTGDGREPTYVNKESTCSNIEPTCSSKENVKGGDQVMGDDQVTGDGREPTYVNKDSTCSNIEPTCRSKADVKGDDQVIADGSQPTYVNKDSTCSNIEPTCRSKADVKGDDQVIADGRKPTCDYKENFKEGEQEMADGRKPTCSKKGNLNRDEKVIAGGKDPTYRSKEHVKGDDQILEKKAHLSNQVHSCSADTPNTSEGGTLRPVASPIGLTDSVTTPVTTDDKSSNIRKEVVASHALNEHVQTVTSIKTQITLGKSPPSSEKTKSTSHTLNKAFSSSDGIIETSKKLSSSLPEFAKLSEIVKRNSFDEDNDPSKKITRNSTEWLQDPAIQKSVELQRYTGMRSPWFTTEKEGVKVVLQRDNRKRSLVGKGGKSPAKPKQKVISKKPATTSSLVTSSKCINKAMENTSGDERKTHKDDAMDHGDISTHRNKMQLCEDCSSDGEKSSDSENKYYFCESSGRFTENNANDYESTPIDDKCEDLVGTSKNSAVSEKKGIDEQGEQRRSGIAILGSYPPKATSSTADVHVDVGMDAEKKIGIKDTEGTLGIEHFARFSEEDDYGPLDFDEEMPASFDLNVGYEDDSSSIASLKIDEGTDNDVSNAHMSKSNSSLPKSLVKESPDVKGDTQQNMQLPTSSNINHTTGENVLSRASVISYLEDQVHVFSDMIRESPSPQDIQSETTPVKNLDHHPKKSPMLNIKFVATSNENCNSLVCTSPLSEVLSENTQGTSPAPSKSIDLSEGSLSDTEIIFTKANDPSEAGESDTKIVSTEWSDPSGASLSDKEILPAKPNDLTKPIDLCDAMPPKSNDPSGAGLSNEEILPSKPSEPTNSIGPSEVGLSCTEIAPTKSNDPSEARLSNTEIAPTKSNDWSKTRLLDIEMGTTEGNDLSEAGLSITERAPTRSSEPSKASLLDTKTSSAKGKDLSEAGLYNTEIAPMKSNDNSKSNLSNTERDVVNTDDDIILLDTKMGSAKNNELAESNLSDIEIDVVNIDDDIEIDVETVTETTENVQNIDPYSSLRDITSRLSSALQKEQSADVPKKSKRRSSNPSSIKHGRRVGSPRKLTGPFSWRKDSRTSNTLVQNVGSAWKLTPQLTGPLSWQNDSRSMSTCHAKTKKKKSKRKSPVCPAEQWESPLFKEVYKDSSAGEENSEGKSKRDLSNHNFLERRRREDLAKAFKELSNAIHERPDQKVPPKIAILEQAIQLISKLKGTEEKLLKTEEHCKADQRRLVYVHSNLLHHARCSGQIVFPEGSKLAQSMDRIRTSLVRAGTSMSQGDNEVKSYLAEHLQGKGTKRKAESTKHLQVKDTKKKSESAKHLKGKGTKRKAESVEELQGKGTKRKAESAKHLQGKDTKKNSESAKHNLGKPHNIIQKKESNKAKFSGSDHKVIKDMEKVNSCSSHSNEYKFKKYIHDFPLARKEMQASLESGDSVGLGTSLNTVLKRNQGTSESALDLSMPSGSQGFVQSGYDPYHMTEDVNSNDEESLPIHCYVSSSDEPEEDEVDFGFDDDEQYSDDGFILESEDENNTKANDRRGVLSDNDGEKKGDKSDQEIVTINIDMGVFEHGTADSRSDRETSRDVESRKRVEAKFRQISQRKEESSLESQDSDDDVLVLSEEPFSSDDMPDKKQQGRGKLESLRCSTVGKSSKFQSQTNSKAMDIPKQDIVTKKVHAIPSVPKTTPTSTTNSTEVTNPTKTGVAKEPVKAHLVDVIDEIMTRLKGDAPSSPVSSVEEKSHKVTGPGTLEMLDSSSNESEGKVKLTSATLTSALRASVATLDASDVSADDEPAVSGVVSRSFNHTEVNVSATSLKTKGDAKPCDVMLDCSESSSDKESTTAATLNSTQHEEENASTTSTKRKSDVQLGSVVLDDSDYEIPSASYTKQTGGVSKYTQLVREKSQVASPQKITKVLPMKGALADLISSVKTRVENDHASDLSDDGENEGEAVFEDEDSDDDSTDEESSNDEMKEEEEMKEDIVGEDKSTSNNVESEKLAITVINKDVAGPSHISGETDQRIEKPVFNFAGSSNSEGRNGEEKEKLGSNDDEAVTSPTSITKGKGKGQGTEKLDKNSPRDDLTSPSFSVKHFDGGSEVQHGFSVGQDTTDDDDDEACLTYAAMGNDEDNEALFDADDCSSHFSSISLDMDIVSDDDIADSFDEQGDVLQSSSLLPPKASSTVAGTSTDETKPTEATSHAEQSPERHQTPCTSSKPDLTLDEAISFLNVEKNSDGTLNVFLKGDYNDEKLDELFEKPEVVDYIMSAAAKKE